MRSKEAGRRDKAVMTSRIVKKKNNLRNRLNYKRDVQKMVCVQSYMFYETGKRLDKDQSMTRTTMRKSHTAAARAH